MFVHAAAEMGWSGNDEGRECHPLSYHERASPLFSLTRPHKHAHRAIITQSPLHVLLFTQRYARSVLKERIFIWFYGCLINTEDTEAARSDYVDTQTYVRSLG